MPQPPTSNDREPMSKKVKLGLSLLSVGLLILTGGAVFPREGVQAKVFVYSAVAVMGVGATVLAIDEIKRMPSDSQ